MTRTKSKMTVHSILCQLESELECKAPALLRGLRAPAESAEVARVERLTGWTWPEEIRQLYAWHDGEDPNPNFNDSAAAMGLFGGTAFLTLRGLEQEWQNWDAIVRDGGMESIDDDCLSVPADCIRELYACRGWIALSSDGAGNCIGVDLDPGPQGTRGQIITFGRDLELKHVLAPSLTIWLAKLLEMLRAEELALSAQATGTIRSLELRSGHVLMFAPELQAKICEAEPGFRGWFEQLPAAWKPIVEALGQSFAELSACRSLSAGGAPVRELAPLRAFSALRELLLACTLVEDLAPVAGCGQLKTLYLSGSLVFNLDPLRHLEQLNSLALGRSQVFDLAPLAALARLRSLSLDRLPGIILESIPVLPHLRELDLSHNHFASFEGLRAWTELQTLDLTGTNLSDLSPVAAMKGLRELRIGGCDGIRELAPLAGLRSLREVTCSGEHFVALKDLLPKRIGFALYGDLTDEQDQLFHQYVTESD